jgi:hypothetical protein
VASEVDAIVRWLRALGVPLERPEQLMATAGPTAELADGVTLARLVETCENLRGSRRGGIPGIDKFPRTGAAKLANIRRCLEVLRGVPAMPLEHLWSEAAIRQGEAHVLRAVLLNMRRAYHHHVPAGAAGGATMPPPHHGFAASGGWDASGAGHGVVV